MSRRCVRFDVTPSGEERKTCVGCPHVEYTKFSDGSTEWPEEGAADAE